jgi:Na+/H+ antiporter NhaD/arsenite permease-like protein
VIPRAIVRLNRSTIVGFVVVAAVLNAPWITTVLFVVIALAACFGRRLSPVYRIGMALFRPAPDPVHDEDPQLMRFNNRLAALMLGGAQIAFVLHVPTVGWALCGACALAAAVALAGFCVGCFLYYQFNAIRRRRESS